MSNDDEMYKYLGLGVVVVLVIYIGVKTLKYQSKLTETNIIESFSDNKSSASAFEDLVKLQRDVYDSTIKNNRTAIENDIILLEEYAQYMIFYNILRISPNIMSNNPKSGEIINNTIDECTRYRSLIDTLNSTMKFIDRK